MKISAPKPTMTLMDAAAIDKAGQESSWRPYLYEHVGSVLLITGCATRPKKSGKNKGETLFLTNIGRKTVSLTKQEIADFKLNAT